MKCRSAGTLHARLMETRETSENANVFYNLMPLWEVRHLAAPCLLGADGMRVGREVACMAFFLFGRDGFG